MDVDSVHSAVDNAKKNFKINAPRKWPVGYYAREVEQEDFDLHSLSKSVGTKGITLVIFKLRNHALNAPEKLI